MNAIHFEHVHKQYRTVSAVTDLSFEIEQGTVVALLGPNGAGKTTAISMMLGLQQPTSGNVRLLGEDPRIPANRRFIGAMLQQVSVPDKTSVRELLNLFCSYYEHGYEPNTLLKVAQLTDLAKEQASRLSGGQQRRLQFALAMAGDPRVLFLDEPTTGMDVASRQLFWEQLRTFSRQDGRTIVLTTHHLEEADAIADRILLLQRGRLVADGTPTQLKKLAAARFVSGIAGPDLTANQLLQLPGSTDVQWSGRHFKLRTADSDATLRGLILAGLPVSDIEVSSGGLEDAFLALTQPDKHLTQAQHQMEVHVG